MANGRIAPYDSSKGNDPWKQQMGSEMEDSATANESTRHLATRRKLIATAGLGFAGLIRTQDVFSMADEESGKV